MKNKLFTQVLCSISLVCTLAYGVSYAMPGMHGAVGGGVTEPPAASKDMGAPINSPGSEIEITYSADGKTAIFVSTRKGSIESSGTPYNFDIWMSHNVNGIWQPPIHLGPDIDPTVGPNINTSDWDLEPSFSDDGNVIYFTRYEPGNLLSGDLYVVQKVDGVWQSAKNWNDVPELPSINTPTGEEHCPIIVSDSLIYFNYSQPGVTQESDIWKVEKKDGVWQKPVSLGAKINSPQRDHMHWTGVSKDGKVWSSPAHGLIRIHEVDTICGSHIRIQMENGRSRSILVTSLIPRMKKCAGLSRLMARNLLVAGGHRILSIPIYDG